MRISGIAVASVNVRVWDGSAWVNFPLTGGGVPVNLRVWDGESWINLLLDPTMMPIVNIGGLENLVTGQASVDDEPWPIIDANAARKSLCIRNIGENPIDLGTADVTWGTGFRLAPGETLSDIRTVAVMYAVCGPELTSTVCYWEE